MSELDDLRKQNLKLQRAVHELSVLNDLSREIGGLADVNAIVSKILQRSIALVDAEQGHITLVQKESQDGEMRTFVREMQTGQEARPFHLEQAIVGWMQLNARPLVVEHDDSSTGWPVVQLAAGMRSLLCVPLLIRSTLTGVLAVYNKKGEGQFSAEDQRLLTIIASQSAQIIENARLYEEEKRLLKIQSDLRLAYEMQVNLLPRSAPEVPGFDIAAASDPAEQVGGDLYDFFESRAGEVGFCLGDVSGKGFPAALLMANVQATLKGVAKSTAEPEVCLRESNRMLYLTTRRGSFTTAIYGVLHPQDSLIKFANAGHNPPMFVSRNGEARFLEKGGLVLGVLPDFVYSADTLRLKDGDLFVAYSDGVTEAMNPDRVQFGEERLQDVLVSGRQATSEQIVEMVRAAVADFAEGASQSDDITLMVIKCCV